MIPAVIASFSGVQIAQYSQYYNTLNPIVIDGRRYQDCHKL